MWISAILHDLNWNELACIYTRPELLQWFSNWFVRSWFSWERLINFSHFWHVISFLSLLFSGFQERFWGLQQSLPQISAGERSVGGVDKDTATSRRLGMSTWMLFRAYLYFDLCVNLKYLFNKIRLGTQADVVGWSQPQIHPEVIRNCCSHPRSTRKCCHLNLQDWTLPLRRLHIYPSVWLPLFRESNKMGCLTKNCVCSRGGNLLHQHCKQSQLWKVSFERIHCCNTSQQKPGRCERQWTSQRERRLKRASVGTL